MCGSLNENFNVLCSVSPILDAGEIGMRNKLLTLFTVLVIV